MIAMKLTPVHGPERWLYLKAFDVNAHDGRGDVTLTDDVSRAMLFVDVQAAAETWRRQSHTHPFRPDGKPNRPLTAYHATFESV